MAAGFQHATLSTGTYLWHFPANWTCGAVAVALDGAGEDHPSCYDDLGILSLDTIHIGQQQLAAGTILPIGLRAVLNVRSSP